MFNDVLYNEPLLPECWSKYDRLHLLTFLADVLRRLKTFQKCFEADTNTILEVPNKKNRIIQTIRKRYLLQCSEWMEGTVFE